MSQNRRQFLQKAGILSAGALLSKNSLFAAPGKEKIKRLGIELWSVKDEMAKDAKGTLQQLASFGYKQVESFQHGQLGMFWGMPPKEFKAYLDSIGLKAFGSHCGDWNKPEFEKDVADAAEAGMQYLICPMLDKKPMALDQTSMDEFKAIADKFNTAGDICKKHGLRFAYHTHGYPYLKLDGKMPIEYLIANTNADTVDFEMDIYWVVTAGADPISLLQKNAGRFRLCHIKDRMKTAASSEENASCIVGEGSIDFAKILPIAKSTGVKYFTVEQERFDGTTPILAAQADAKYVLTLDI
jgi:sugar phosphate isomerase/epimerase